MKIVRLSMLVLAMLVLASFASAQELVTGAELTKVVPTSFYFEGQSAPTQARNTAAARVAKDRYIIAGLVDTSGYSTEVRAKYIGFLITDQPITVGGTNLGTGAYGFGFSDDGMVNVFDVSGAKIASGKASKDADIKRPRPLMMSKGADGLRLYAGRSYAIIAVK
jgi:hypothetical protein